LRFVIHIAFQWGKGHVILWGSFGTDKGCLGVRA
jgi:hypothetical protein